MKKALLIGLVLGLVVGLAVPAMAVDLTASGFIGMRGYVFRNAQAAFPLFVEYNPGPPLAVYSPGFGARAGMNDEMGSYINSRAELGFTVRASEDLYGFFKFRMDSDHFGTDSDNRYGIEGGGAIAVKVQELFLDFRIPQMPVWARVGLQPVAIRPWIFMFNDAPGVSLRTMIDPIKLSATAYYAKMADPDNWAATDGAEFWAIDTKIPFTFGSFNIAPGVFFAYEDIRYSTAPYTPGVINPSWLQVSVLDDMSLWWIGANFDGGVGPVKYQFDFIYNGGEMEAVPGNNDIDVSSWLVNGSLSFMFKKFEIGVAGKYITGEDYDDYDTSQMFYLPGDRNWTATGYASETPAVSGDFIVFDNGWFTNGPGWPGMGLIDGPSCYWPGIWNARMFVYYQALDWLRLGAQFGYIGDTVSGTRLVTSITEPFVAAGDAIGNDADDDDSIGWEFDFGVNIQIYKNLALETGFGYLIAHKALSQVGGFAPADPWALQSRLMYFF